ncbi:hypothetical protein T459_27321 [Capsicum annuum]|uniref:Ubiquitin-like protease family profile domain-containing protein n=1 Tax=Capsicum annuum TaxID=4072 RepID=A0A2G2YDK9_CAPAN|nr:hypothetical protein T459_27321 [Capsicum annuum]
MDVASDEEIERLSVDVASNSSGLLPSNLIDIIVDVNFYLEKGIAKSENDTLPIKMVDELPQQTQCDCGAFVCAFAEYVIHGRDIPKEIDIGHVHMRYGALLWDYGKRKLEAGIKGNTIEKVGRLFGKEKRKRTHQE